MSERSEPQDVVVRRLRSVVNRLDVALQFRAVDASVASQVVHALGFAVDGPPDRTDDDYLPDIGFHEAAALVHALLPFVRAARRRPPPEGPS